MLFNYRLEIKPSQTLIFDGNWNVAVFISARRGRSEDSCNRFSVKAKRSEAAQVGSVPSTITLQSFTAAAQAHKHQLTSVISFAELWRAEGLPGHMEIPQQPPLLQHHLDYY